MTHIWQGLRSGEWLTAARARGYSLLLLGFCVLAMAGWIALSDHLIDRNGKPLGTDFSSFYAAGSLALDGHAKAAYDMAAHLARQQDVFGAGVPYYGWFYPPFFLFIAAPLALMPYPIALAVWQGSTLALYLGAIGAILRSARRSNPALDRLWILAALAFPAVFVNLGHGQNGFLTAALFGGALAALPARPLAAGVLFGLLAYKPQFALVIPVALLAGGHWRTVAAAAVTVIALVAATCMAFGVDIWVAFAASTEISRKLLLEQGDVGFEKLQSVFAAMRMWGGSISLAYLVQGAASAATIGGVFWTWRSAASAEIKAAALVIAALLASPHTLDYDLMLLAPAIAFIASAGLKDAFRGYEISLLAAAWLVPLLSREVAGNTGIPLGLVVTLALYGFILRRVALGRTGSPAAAHRLAQA